MRIFRRLHATLDRIDDTIDRHTDAFDRNTDAFDRNTDAFDRNTDAFDRHERAFKDLQVVIRESALRQDRVFQSMIEQLEANTAQIRAQTDAIWRMLDRWGEGPSPAS